MEQGGLIEHPVDIGHHHIAPAGHFLRQEIGADTVLAGDVGQYPLGQGTGVIGSVLAGRRQSVKEALCQRAGVPMARLVRMLAGMVLGHQFQGSQGQWAGLLFPQQVNGIDSQLPGGIAAGQVE